MGAWEKYMTQSIENMKETFEEQEKELERLRVINGDLADKVQELLTRNARMRTLLADHNIDHDF